MPYSHPILRDLAWLLSSPPLVEQPPYTDLKALTRFAAPLWPLLPALSSLPASPLLRIRPIARLGHYYEQLWLLAFSLHPDYHLIDRDVLVKEDKRVIGSADFVLKHLPTGQLEHWEVAVKFYLGRGTGLESWIGPGKQDRLADKLARLEHHQLPLLSQPEGLRLCQQRGWEIARRRIVLQGRLYSPANHSLLPAPLSLNAPQGQWHRHSQLPSGHYRRLARTDWLAGRDWRLLSRYRAPSTLDWPKHLYDVDRHQHCFVVPDDW
ncbi:DUF1853 family protein [Ferrimonas balearica]|uniref:DUF1853 family protein n=1 Tax=Ferrimonas balearica TaxID=44012 RepID=UPI001C992463|nr:DUF1853 family protein [Ferrimonas balearica]MBY5920476.1 DUF1853 family protein [Ferrimonas balearica]MBY5996839.1 DUF1853 family protein [Ferrimonas balearica]